jgi:hypothetical protein
VGIRLAALGMANMLGFVHDIIEISSKLFCEVPGEMWEKIAESKNGTLAVGK